MPSPSNREEFTQYCLRDLGDPVIQVNVSVQQVDDRVTEALEKFYERHYDAVEEFTAMYVISEEEVEATYITLPDEWVGVTDVMKPLLSAGTSSIEYQQYINEIMQNQKGAFGSVQYYYMQRANLTLLNRFFSPDKTFNFNQLTHKLIIAGGLRSTYNEASPGIIIRGFKKIYGELPEGDEGSNTVIHNIWKNRWLQKYATALIRRQWAQNLSKYQNVQLLGGVSMNGAEMMALAREEIQLLEEELNLAYELPPIGFLG